MVRKLETDVSFGLYAGNTNSVLQNPVPVHRTLEIFYCYLLKKRCCLCSVIVLTLFQLFKSKLDLY